MERRSGDAHVTDAGRTVAPSASRRRSGVMWGHVLSATSSFFSLRVLHKEQWLGTCERLQSSPSQQRVGGTESPTSPIGVFLLGAIRVHLMDVPAARGSRCNPATRAYSAEASLVGPPRSLGLGRKAQIVAKASVLASWTHGLGSKLENSLVVDILPSLLDRCFSLSLFLCVPLSSLEKSSV